jgi:regulator of protease activity HflC (stomatin/prohibitin superfamily)
MFGLPMGTFVVVVVVAIFFLNWIKVLNEYERGVIFRFGKLLPYPKGPGLIFVFSPIDKMVKWMCRLRT